MASGHLQLYILTLTVSSLSLDLLNVCKKSSFVVKTAPPETFLKTGDHDELRQDNDYHRKNHNKSKQIYSIFLFKLLLHKLNSRIFEKEYLLIAL